MYKTLLGSALFPISVIGEQPLLAEQCEQFAVTASDGYVNVRSSPEVQPDNIMGTLHTGSSIAVSTKRQGWWQINSPLQGWVAGNQVGKVSCEALINLLFEIGYPAINHLSERAIQGDRQAAETLVKMSRGMDGAAAEFYAEAITNFANQNPNFLLSVLNQQSPSIRQTALQLIDFGFGMGKSPERQKFEAIINQLPFNNIVLQDWRNIKRAPF